MENLCEKSILETEGVGKLMRRYSLPCIISLLVGALYNIVDQIFIANADYLGSCGNAANSAVFPLTVIALAIATMIGDGCCAFVSINSGAGNTEKAKHGIGNAITFTVAVSLVLTAIYFIFSSPILRSFGADVNAETYRLSEEYFFWISLGIPLYMFGQALNPIIRSDGSPRFAMIALLSGAVTNCILDPVFIYPCKMGMRGAAIATVLGQLVSAVLSLVYILKSKNLRLCRNEFKVELKLIKRILTLGISSFLAQISIVLTMAAVLNSCKKYGALDTVFSKAEYAQIPTAVIGIVMKLFQIIISISVGMAAGCIPVIGFNAGAGRYDRVSAMLRRLLICEIAVGAAATVIFELFPLRFINIFGAANESLHYSRFAVRSIRLLLSTLPLACFNKGFCIFLQALGKAWLSTALSVLREILFGIGVVLLLPLWLGLEGILWFMPISDLLTFIVTVPIIMYIAKKKPNGNKSVSDTD